MKKIIALLTAMLMIVSFAGCGNSKNSDKADSEYVKDKGTLIVGMTDFEPMDYKDGDKWIGFDADMATAFAESLGAKVKFVEINWDNKIMELNGKSIDCVWNGMTLNDEVKKSMSTSNAYCNNAQVVVVPKDKADKYKTKEDIKDLKFACEAGSAGEEAINDLGYSLTSLETQSACLMEVAAGTSDACVIDLLMAAAMVGEGTSYENLTHTVELTSEKYGVGFRKESDLTEKLNDYFKKSLEDGSMMKIAEKYGVQDSVIGADEK